MNNKFFKCLRNYLKFAILLLVKFKLEICNFIERTYYIMEKPLEIAAVVGFNGKFPKPPSLIDLKVKSKRD